MTPIRLAGSLLSLLNGAWAAYIAYYGFKTVPPCSNCFEAGLPTGTVYFTELQAILFFLGAILALLSLFSFAGLRAIFMLGAVLSVIVLALVLLQWGDYAATWSGVAVALSLAAILVDAVASRPSKGLSEKDSPLNLPVFG